jgi:hypothetical protein
LYANVVRVMLVALKVCPSLFDHTFRIVIYQQNMCYN